MASKQPKGMKLHRKLQILKKLTNSKSVKESSIIMDAFLHILKLKVKLQALKRQHLYLMEHYQEVKVDKVGDDEFLMRVTCKKGQEKIVSILESFEEMGLEVMEARVTGNWCLIMEAIVKDPKGTHHEEDIKVAVEKAILKYSGVGLNGRMLWSDQF